MAAAVVPATVRCRHAGGLPFRSYCAYVKPLHDQAASSDALSRPALAVGRMCGWSNGPAIATVDGAAADRPRT
jgi:hypothetical protein